MTRKQLMLAENALSIQVISVRRLESDQSELSETSEESVGRVLEKAENIRTLKVKVWTSF